MSNKDFIRQKTLIELDLLNTNSEKMFDDITKLAAKTSKMPVSLITSLGTEKQVFKSNFGLSISKTPIEQSFCKIAIQNPNEILAVKDARKDSRFSDNPLVCKDPKIVSYFGMPIKSPSGIALGTLCLIDFVVRELSDDQKEILKILAKQVEYLIELRSKTDTIQKHSLQINQYTKEIKEFSSVAIHDLKAPIRAINSFMKLLDNKHQNTWDVKDKTFIKFIFESTLKINSLIASLTEFVKSIGSDYSDEEFNLKDLIQETFNNLTIDLKETPTLICNHIPITNLSKKSFSLLFKNILSNAITYRKENEKLIIEIKSTEENNHHIITVKDNGIGIDPQFFDSIFEPFKRLHADSTYPGNGLGLSVCRNIITGLNGTITVNSAPNVGSTFTIMIPKV